MEIHNSTLIGDTTQIYVQDWVPAGTISVSSTGTVPSKGTTLFDTKRYRRINSDTYEVDYNFAATTVGTAGSGQYLFGLPTGITWGSGVLMTTGTDAETVGNYALPAAGCALDTATRFRPVMIVPYSSTLFRVIHLASTTSEWTWFGTGGVNFALDGVSFKFRFYTK